MVVVHGTAVMDVLSEASYARRHDGAGPNATLRRKLMDAGTRVIGCGQSAASRGVESSKLLEEVEVALSAMTAFVMVRAGGFRVYPW